MKVFLFNEKMSLLFLSVQLLFLVSSFLSSFVSPAQHFCHPDQRDVLLEFKNEFKIQKPQFLYTNVSCYSKTESWVNDSDCCSWDGIRCDAKSGDVVGLDLGASCLHGRLESNSCLFKLDHLRDLNLAYNNFTDCPISSEFEKLKELEKLNLSRSSFSGQIPTKLLKLTKLVSLDLSDNPYSSQNSQFVDKSFLSVLAQNLKNLKDLDISYVNISSTIPGEFSNMSSLRSLRLEGCNLFGEFPNSVFLKPNLESIELARNENLRGTLPVFLGNNYSLQIIGLSGTNFSGSIPDSISNLKNLALLHLYGCTFSGRIPSSIGNLSHLSSLVLSFNSFSGEIPSSIGNLSHLSSLDLSGNSFSGEIPSSIGNLKLLTFFNVGLNKLSGNVPSELLNLTQLIDIDLSDNQLTGFLPNISQFSKLEMFFASGNSFTGAIPPSLFSIPSLTHIDLRGNQLSDLIGIENISLLRNLTHLYLQGSKFMVSPVDFRIFSSLKQLQVLYLSGVPLLSTANTTFASNLSILQLSRSNITEFPEFIRSQRYLYILDLSNNKIKGHVPAWLWKLPELSDVYLSNNSFSGFNGSLKALPTSRIQFLDLSSNSFQGPIFIPSISIQYFSASKNNFTGEIPRFICELTSVYILDLSSNNLHGSIPPCLENQLMSSLIDLNLRENNLNGSLPDIFNNATALESLDVGHNRLEGKLPASLKGCSALEILNVESNRINDSFPFHLNALKNLQILVLRSNKFHGMLHHFGGFHQLKIIDVSDNAFYGFLPSDYFQSWTAMFSTIDNYYNKLEYVGDRVTDYYNSLVLMSKGVSMKMERILTIYTAIDLSGNQLHGQIPDSVGLLKQLRILNLSSNAFTGHIPSSLANLTNLESLDLSQNKISGEIPPQLGTISSLEWINVSHNHLVGSVPQGTQFQRQNCSSYEGNPGLFAPSLKDMCGDRSHASTSPQPNKQELEEDDEEEWFSLKAALFGLVFGVLFGLTMGYKVALDKYVWFKKTFGIRKR